MFLPHMVYYFQKESERGTGYADSTAGETENIKSAD